MVFILAMARASVVPAAATGQLVLDTVHGRSLEKSLTEESPDRTVAIYLPPSYAESPGRRYPVLYLLHGIGATHEDWMSPDASEGWGSIPALMDEAIAEHRVAEFIIVAPNEMTRGGGSWYTNSEVIGAWEDFTTVDLVEYVDAHYRTLPKAASRGIAGHSMGGYGAIMLGMKHPDVFQVVYGISSALLGFAENTDLSEENLGFARAGAATPETLNPREDAMAASILCVAQAFSPDPQRPPFLVDLPYELREGRLQKAPECYSRWQSKMPLYVAPTYEKGLRELRGLRFDAGRYDQYTHIPPTNRAFSQLLTDMGIPHTFEEYNGDHRDRLWGGEGRLATEVLPWFSRVLSLE
ncbi:MAG: esterase [Candidatus Eisenbacteria bacterium]|uniref:Esterase n=1 Tax=Eiseniibacteriota bacterium TaxID=2212470 RepID=A0A956RMM8_UNCEI|nr:esterase [Candidatus Eisenbacteria bacterium]